MTPEMIVQQAHDGGARLVRFLYCDNGGTIRGKATALSGLGGRLSDGIGLTVAMMAMNSRDELQPVDGMGPVGEIRLIPDPASFALLPYAPHSAAMSCDMLMADRTPWDACPRSFLKRMRDRAAARGWELYAALEAEFSLGRRTEDGGYTPFDDALCFSSIAMTQAAPFAGALVAALEAQGIIVEQYYPELGHGQHEISIRHAEALRAADNHIKLRETIRGVALEYGLYASLAPKPFPDQAGNGAHIHFSLWDGHGRNVFYDRAAPDGLSTVGRQFMAGVLTHLPALVALTCPSFNSYKRLQPQSWSSAFTAWGHDNREAALRVASPFWSDVEGSTNLELKAADSSCNPYIALGGLLAAGLDGVERGLDPGEPTESDPASLSDAERAARGIHRLPASLDQAIDELAADAMLTGALGDLLGRSYMAVRRSEARAYAAMDEEQQFREHYYKY
ncbi:MAG TPA: glutamine synthetase family protein [Roseiflexaceae bacterium]|nr:glutamine synthetase family protein [Roseiflexaceae bacterium]